MCDRSAYTFFKFSGIFAFLAMLLATPLVGQETETTVTTRQLWLDYNQKWGLSNRIAIGGSGGIKTISTDQWNRFYLKPEFVYSVPKFMLKQLKYKEALLGGVELYYNQNHDGVDVVEFTPFQAYSLTWPNRKRLDIRHYVKLKERFQFDTKDWNNSFGLKLSYELSFTFKFQGRVWEFGKGLYLPVALKFYWNLIDAAVFNNVFRITPGIGYKFNEEWKAAFLVGYNRTRNGADQQFKTNDIIFRLRIYHTAKSKKK